MRASGVLPKNKWILTYLIVILSLGCILRFYGLANQSFWLDELYSWIRSTPEGITTVIKHIRQNEPPGYYIILYFVQKYIGENESALRLPSAVSGVLSIYFTFLVGAQLYTDKEGIIASTIMTVAWAPIYYSQEARSYAMLVLFTLAATYFWILLLKTFHRRHTKFPYFAIIGYITAAIISCYLHYFGLLLIVVQGLGTVILFIKRRQVLTYCVFVYLPIILAYLPWFPFMVEDFKFGPTWIPQPEIYDLIGFITFFFNYSHTLVLIVLILYSSLFTRYLHKSRSFKRNDVGSTYKWIDLWPGLLLITLFATYLGYIGFSTDYSTTNLIVFLILFSFIIILSSYESRYSKINFDTNNSFPAPGWLLVSWLFVPFAIAYTMSVVSKPVLVYRYLMISLPAAYILLSRSITQLPLRPVKNIIFNRPPGNEDDVQQMGGGDSNHPIISIFRELSHHNWGLLIVILIIAITFLSNLIFVQKYYSEPVKSQYREAVYYIVNFNDHYRDDSIIIGYGGPKAFFNYYFEKRDSAHRVTIRAGKEKDISRISNKIEKEAPRYIWYIIAHQDPEKEFLDFLQKSFTLIRYQYFIGAKVWLFENN